MAVVDFLLNGKHNVTLAHFDHGTEYGKNARRVVEEFSEERKLTMFTQTIKSDVNFKGKSKEEVWRNQRYNFFDELLEFYDHRIPLITCHHLDDQIETWIFYCLRGNPKLIPYRRGNIIRPFLVTKKEAFIDWCDRRKVQYLSDPSNLDSKYMRNHIRNNIIPLAMVVNPGLDKVVRRKVLDEFEKLN